MSDRDLYALLSLPRANGERWAPTALTAHDVLEAHFQQPYAEPAPRIARMRSMSAEDFMRAIEEFRWRPMRGLGKRP